MISHISHLNSQANIAGVLATPKAALNEILLHQLTHLRLAVDEFVLGYLQDHPEVASTAALGGGAGAAGAGTDLASQLDARQHLRGRDRRTLAMALPA